MALFNIEDLRNISFEGDLGNHHIEICSVAKDFFQKVIFELKAYKIDFCGHRKGLSVAYIYADFCDNHVYIVDCRSKLENLGIGKEMFNILFQCIFVVNKTYPITKICGFLSPKDFDHWDKLIYFYGSLNEYIISNSKLPIRLDFRLRKYTISDLLLNMTKYRNENIYFDIFITYYSQ